MFRLLTRAALGTAVLLAAGCGDVQEISGAVVTVQACEEAIQVATGTPGRIKDADPGTVRQVLEEGAASLDQSARTAGDATLHDAMTGLADTYREAEKLDPAAAGRKVASHTAKYLQVITAGCAGA